MFGSACFDENVYIETSKVSPLLLQVYSIYRCLHLTPIKEKEHPGEIYAVFRLGLSRDVYKTEVAALDWVIQQIISLAMPVRKMITMHLGEKSVGFNGGGKRWLNVIPNLCNMGELIPFAFRGENMSFMIRN